jgi:hypothetical protein
MMETVVGWMGSDATRNAGGEDDNVVWVSSWSVMAVPVEARFFISKRCCGGLCDSDCFAAVRVESLIFGNANVTKKKSCGHWYNLFRRFPPDVLMTFW